MKKRSHKHRWSKAYHGYWKESVRLCLGGPCGAMKFSNGVVIFVREKVAK